MAGDPTETDGFVRRLLDTYNRHSPEAFDALLTEDCVLVRNAVEARGREAVQGAMGRLYRAFPDIEYQIDDAVMTDDSAAIRWEATATHRGEYLGVPPTGRRIRYDGITLHQLRGDRIPRLWVSADELPLLRSLTEREEARPQPEAHP